MIIGKVVEVDYRKKLVLGREGGEIDILVLGGGSLL